MPTPSPWLCAVYLVCLAHLTNARSSACARMDELTHNFFSSRHGAGVLVEVCFSDCDVDGYPVLVHACRAIRAGRRLEEIGAHAGYDDRCAPMAAWNRSRVESWLHQTLPNQSATVTTLLARDIDGASLAALSKTDLNAIFAGSLSLAVSTRLLSAISTSTLGTRQSKLPVDDPCSTHYASPDWRIFVNMFMEKLLNVDEELYEFTAKLRGHADFFKNLKSVDVLQERLWVFGGGINTVLQVKYITATFNSDMSFIDFPFDQQQLLMSFRVNWDSESVKLELDDIDCGSKKAPGWVVRGITHEVGDEHVTDTYKIKGDANPMKAIISGGNMYSFFTVSITVDRESAFYSWNMIMPIWLLTILSWSAFFVDPLSIDVRIGMVLTIMLGFIAFQFVVNDNMPKTSDQSKLHRFMNLANIYIAIVGAESLFVYKLAKDDLGFLVSALARILGIEKIGEELSHHLASARPDRQSTASIIGDDKSDASRKSTASSVTYDGTSSVEELKIIGHVDQFSAMVIPLSFGLIAWVQMRDKVSEIILASLCTLVLAAAIGNCWLGRLGQANATRSSNSNDSNETAARDAGGGGPASSGTTAI